MQPDVTITIEQLEILDEEGCEYGYATDAEVDLYFDGNEVYVYGVRYLPQSAKGRTIVVRGACLDAYQEFMQKNYDARLHDALVDWVDSKSARIADSRNRAMREAV